MKVPVNYDLEKHLLNGCKIIRIDSVNYDSISGDFTHALLECPKDYKASLRENTIVRFIAVQTYDDAKWFDATEYYCTRREALKKYYDNLTEDRVYKKRSKEFDKAV